MTSIRKHLGVLIIAFAVSCSRGAESFRHHDESWNRVSAVEEAAGWELLWDGRSLRGWRGADDAAPAHARWKIADGVLFIDATGQGASRVHLKTEKNYSAFELRFQFQLTSGANSGVKYLVTIEANGDRLVPIGPEYQLLDDNVHPDAKRGIDGNRTLGSLYDVVARRKGPLKLEGGSAVGNWQEGRIVVHPSGSIEHWLNGENYSRLTAPLRSSNSECLPARMRDSPVMG